MCRTDWVWEYLIAAVSHLAGQLLILLHQFLILLVDGQHLADTVGSRLSLGERERNTSYSFTRNRSSHLFIRIAVIYHVDGVLCIICSKSIKKGHKLSYIKQLGPESLSKYYILNISVQHENEIWSDLLSASEGVVEAGHVGHDGLLIRFGCVHNIWGRRKLPEIILKYFKLAFEKPSLERKKQI